MKLACQNRITFRRAVSLTYMANSLINAIRLQRAEDLRATKEPGELQIDWTDVLRPDYDKARLARQQPLSDTLHTRSRLIRGFGVEWPGFGVLGLVLTSPKLQKSYLQTPRCKGFLSTLAKEIHHG